MNQSRTAENQPAPDEASLIRRAKSGDASAFGRLYDACVQRIYRYVFFRVTDAEVAEDLTSEVFLKAWENLHRYRPGGPFVAWLYTIARNTVIDHYRTRKASISLDQTVVKLDPGLDEKVDLQYEVETLQRAMQHLTEEQREVLSLRFIAEMDTDQIAQRMRKSEGAIRALQMRALQALAKVMSMNGRQET
ncbi:MAG TPA: sigma-70 family RNA polymerase sigma factor [Anaerolineales bacterium]